MPARRSPFATAPEAIAARLHAVGSGPAGYRLHRIILCNYWHFGLQTFEVPHGRLFLTGDNATGKSTALVAAMLTLDGDVRPHRLDTFGSAERQIAAYVLGTRGAGKSGGYEHTARTSLVATEWAWCGPPDAAHPASLTLGLVFVGNASNADPVRTWRFLLLDGARLDTDVGFLDDGGRLLDARLLRTRFGAHGQVLDRVEAYKAQVAQHLFGFRDTRDMDRLIDWLLLLRKPNLTSRLGGFSEVTEFIRQALPPLPAETTAQITQTFEHLVALRQALDERIAVAEATERISHEEQAQRLALARLRAYDVREVGVSQRRAAARLADKQRLLARLERELAAAEATLEESQREVSSLDEQLRRLEDSADIRTAAAIRARLGSAEAEAAQAERLVGRQQTLFAEADERAAAARQAHAALAERWRARLADRRLALAGLRADVAELWPDGVAHLDALVAELDHRVDLEAAASETGDPPPTAAASAALAALLDGLRETSAHLVRLVQRQERLRAARTALDHAEERLADADRAVADEQARTDARAHERADAWRRLGERITTLRPGDDPAWDAILAHVRAEDETAYRTASDDLDAQLAAQAAEQLAAERACGDRIGALRARAETLAEQARALGGAPRADHGPLGGEPCAEDGPLDRGPRAEHEHGPLGGEPSAELGPLARRALACLADAGIEARPLGAVLDAAPELAEAEAGQIERALDAAGLLEALVVPRPLLEAAASRLAQADLPGALLLPADAPGGPQTARLPLVVDPTVAGDPSWAATATAALASLPATLDSRAAAAGRLAIRPAGAQDAQAADVLDARVGGELDGRAAGAPDAGVAGALDARAADALDGRAAGELEVHVADAPGGGAAGALGAGAAGAWRHGVLGGRVAAGARLGRLGSSHRRARRQRELEHLAAERATLQTALDGLLAERGALVGRHDALLALRSQVRRAPEEVGLGAAQARLAQAQESLLRIQRTRDAAAAAAETQRGDLARLAEDAGADSDPQPDAAPRLRRLQELEQTLLAERTRLDALPDVWLARQAAQQRLAEAEAHTAALSEALVEAQRQRAQAIAQVEVLRAQRDRGQASETALRLDRVREARREAEETLRAADRQVGVLASRREDAAQALAEAVASATDTRQGEDTAVAALAAVIADDPAPAFEAAAQCLRASDPLGAAAALLEGAESDRLSLERAHASARDRFVRVFAERRPLLVEVQPFIEDDRVHVRCEGRRLALGAFRLELAADIAARRALITEEEEQLFTTFLLEGAAGQIGEALQRAETWVAGVNAVLERIPLVHERYVLEVRPASDLSGPLARHYALLRTPPDALSPEQRQTVLDALREAATEAQRRHEQSSSRFMDELERLLDYRGWLRLDVAVIRANGQRVVLTDRVARTRSGAEQMMAQYVPLFAALSALYDLAAPWAPRLLALDEAFDKASDESSQQMLRFLVSQHFQWLMTSPRLTGQGDAVPVYAEYLMVHDRASQRAHGIPFFAELLADQPGAA